MDRGRGRVQKEYFGNNTEEFVMADTRFALIGLSNNPTKAIYDIW